MLKFTIIDNTVNLGTSTVIDEPVGWDGIGMRLKRDKGWHGFFDFVDDSLTSLEFDGAGRDVLAAAYDLAGAEAEMSLLIEYQCSETDSFDTLYTGRFVFIKYEFICGDRCYVTCGLETTSCIMQFKNRYDQKVDLDSLDTFEPCACNLEETITVGGEFDGDTNKITIDAVDGGIPDDINCLKEGYQITVGGSASNDGEYTVLGVTLVNEIGGNYLIIDVEESLVDEIDASFTLTGCLTPTVLPAYDGLGKEITLPTKPISFADDWFIPTDPNPVVMEVADPGFPGSGLLPHFLYITFDWDELLTDIAISDPEIFDEVTSDADTFEGWSELYHGVIEFFKDSPLQCDAEFEVRVMMEGEIVIQSDDGLIVESTEFALVKTDANGVIIQDELIFDAGGDVGTTVTLPFSFDETRTFNLLDGQRLYFVFRPKLGYQISGPITDPYVISITIDAGEFQASSDSRCSQTKSKVYLINEAMSRATEAYTNDCLRVYSDYFGRTDAQPYTSEDDGCAGLTSITSGMHIRVKENNKIRVGGANDDAYDLDPRMVVSMKEMFDAMNAVHNIGMGIEDDPNRPGNELIRVEPMNYFYNNSVTMTCDHIKEVKRELNMEALLSIFKVGYEKWETENANGLNDVFGKREYRTTLNQIRSTYERLCKFIASDYAIEVTRRAYGTNTSDWRYDNNTFIILLSRKLCVPIVFNEVDGDYFIIFNDSDYATEFQVGDTVTITGTASNNGTFTINEVGEIGIGNTYLKVDEAVTDEEDDNACVTISSGYPFVETNIVTGSTNILFPEATYNLRITPARNALRHFKTILQCYRQFLTGEIIFTNGEGNSIAVIELMNTIGCLIEAEPSEGESILEENGNIDLNKFETPADHYPLFRPERVKFEYPVTYAQYLLIKANPYGLIEFQCGDGPIEEGWIEDFQYKPYTGMAEFTLKPKI